VLEGASTGGEWKPLKTDTLIDLIRHGEPVGGRRYRGNGTNDPLSDVGWGQMWQALGDESPWHRVVSSPLERCRSFAAALASQRGLPLVVEPQLREVGMGSWEGRTPDEVREREPDSYEAFYRDPLRQRPPGAEPLETLIERVGRAYDRLVCGHPGQHLLLVVHAGVMRALTGRVLNADPERWYRIRIDYAGLVRIRHGSFGPALEFVNAAALR
jgi:probable phosphoglycerate mutase